MILRTFSLSFLFGLAALLYGASATPALAYLDPGTGSMILQLMLGGIAGVAVAGKFYWHRLLVLFGVREASEPAERTDESASARHRAE